MSDILLDANVIVGLLDERDSLSARARSLMVRLESEGRQPVFADFLLAEALSALRSQCPFSPAVSGGGAAVFSFGATGLLRSSRLFCAEKRMTVPLS